MKLSESEKLEEAVRKNTQWRQITQCLMCISLIILAIATLQILSMSDTQWF